MDVTNAINSSNSPFNKYMPKADNKTCVFKSQAGDNPLIFPHAPEVLPMPGQIMMKAVCPFLDATEPLCCDM